MKTLRNLAMEASAKFAGRHSIAGVAVGGGTSRALLVLVEDTVDQAGRLALEEWARQQHVSLEFRITGPIILAGE